MKKRYAFNIFDYDSYIIRCNIIICNSRTIYYVLYKVINYVRNARTIESQERLNER